VVLVIEAFRRLRKVVTSPSLNCFIECELQAFRFDRDYVSELIIVEFAGCKSQQHIMF
jgi:hypothetical protein